MNTNLWAIRLKSIAWTVGGVALTAVVGYFTSDAFAGMLQEFTGSAAWATIIALAVTELAKHIRNKGVIKTAIAEDSMIASSSVASNGPFLI